LPHRRRLRPTGHDPHHAPTTSRKVLNVNRNFPDGHLGILHPAVPISARTPGSAMNDITPDSRNRQRGGWPTGAQRICTAGAYVAVFPPRNVGRRRHALLSSMAVSDVSAGAAVEAVPFRSLLGADTGPAARRHSRIGPSSERAEISERRGGVSAPPGPVTRRPSARPCAPSAFRAPGSAARRHRYSGFGCLSPVQFEEQHVQPAVKSAA
jgi:hypothetical protein